MDYCAVDQFVLVMQRLLGLKNPILECWALPLLVQVSVESDCGGNAVDPCHLH